VVVFEQVILLPDPLLVYPLGQLYVVVATLDVVTTFEQVVLLPVPLVV
jgi:hypothetical protein